MWMPNMWELVIVLVIVLVIFGPGKLSHVGRSLGGAISEFKESVKGKEDREKAEAAKKSDDSEAAGKDA